MIRAWTIALGLALIVAGAAVTAGCNVNQYCVNCATNDAALTDGGDGDAADAVFDGNMPQDACVPNGVEICDGVDNDCDGKTDENTTAEPLPNVGDACSSNVGECTAGQLQCTTGKLVCSGKTPKPEECNNKDDNCDGMVDNGDPGGGGICGTDVGECISGVNHCVGGAVVCTGNVGPAAMETCDGKDNDCDGMFDEDVPPLGSCGPAQGNVGECKLGTLMCVGGQTQCEGAVYPTLDLCNALDEDCDGNPTNNYDLNKDPQNCMTCGHVCVVPHGIPKCTAGVCGVASCDPGWFDIDKNPANGCEYACDFQGPVEACNGQDDNCNGQIDENLTVPALCATKGECAGTVATCHGVDGFKCDYPATVSTDANGVIVPEASCDGKDNDCNGIVDDPFPSVGTDCADAGKGICQGTGKVACNSTKDGVTCNITKPGGTSTTESCNGLDDDCDGVVDNGAATGNLPGQSWVTLATGHQIMQYEASRPDAKAAVEGTMATQPCSKSGVQPWTDVTAPQAAAACTSIGAHLCSEVEWQRACSAVTPTVYPINEPSANNGQIYVEAEDYFADTVATSTGTTAATRTWEPDYTIGFSGMMALHANPDTGANVSLANGLAQAPRLDYRVNFTTTGNHYVWLLLYSPASSGNTVGVGVVANTTTVANPTQTLTTTANLSWQWVRAGTAFNVATAGVGVVSVFMREDGMKIDAVVVTRSSSTTAPTVTPGPAGNIYAYDTSPGTYQATTCNGLDYDTDPVAAGNQDDVIATGSLASCDANWAAAGKIYDLTGNVQEWTAARIPGVNPIRGGASNDIQGGLTCQLAFGAADDSFFFPNVGFRCCR